MRGRFLSFPAFYGYDAGGVSVMGRQIRPSEADDIIASLPQGGQEEIKRSQEKPLRLMNSEPVP